MNNNQCIDPNCPSKIPFADNKHTHSKNQDWQERLRQAEKDYPMSITNWDMEDWIKFITQEKEASRREAIQECMGILIDDLRVCSAHKHDLPKLHQLLNNNSTNK